MSDQPTPEMKTCPYCGRQTAVSANFCYWCARELVARPERPEAAAAKKPLRIPVWVWVALGLLLLGAAATFFWR